MILPPAFFCPNTSTGVDFDFGVGTSRFPQPPPPRPFPLWCPSWETPAGHDFPFWLPGFCPLFSPPPSWSLPQGEKGLDHRVSLLPVVQSCRQPPHGRLDLFLIFNFVLIGQIPSGYFSPESYGIFGAGNKSILFGARRGPGQNHFKENAKQRVPSLSSPACLPPSVLRLP